MDFADGRGMPAPISLDVRERVVKAYEAGYGTLPNVARLFGISRSCLAALLHQYRQTGFLAPKPHGGGHPAAYAGETLEDLRQRVHRQPDATLEELRDQTGVACSLTAVHNTLKRLRLRLKKRHSTPASRSGRT
jgi:transposase